MSAPGFIFKQAVTVEPYEGETGAGGPAYGDPVPVRAHIEPSVRLVIDSGGREVKAEALALVPTGTTIPPESRLNWNGRAFRVITSLQQPGPSGAIHHIEVSLG
jgi:hypothetical protein